MQRVALALGLAALIALGPAAAQSPAPVVVELFTSEGCSSCPPADEFLGELAQRSDVLALAFHVDYWDYLGWTDRFASPEFTHRQRRYAKILASPMVYTPQAVIGGVYHAVGSDRDKLERLITTVRDEAKSLAIDLAWTPSGDLESRIPDGDQNVKATVWFVRYDKADSSDVTAGENAGRTLDHTNVVRELKAIGMWMGEAITLMLPAEVSTPE
ncbi:MAG: DUF1223 domain-containing protein [Alphaproteobacteria bacterium]|nr:DUF1223 domain-containing protein [Alphaproteobacteria bacterium]